VLPHAESYEELRAQFRWDVPQFYNIAADICDRWGDGSGRLALIH
jgi:acetyl-CoA synthetase